MPKSDEAGLPSDLREFRMAFGSLLVAALILIWIPNYLPLTDYPEHLLTIQVLAHYHDPLLNYARDYTVQLRNVPYVSVYLLGMWLNRSLPIFVVGKLLLSIYILFTPLSLLSYLRALRSVSPWTALLSFAFLFNLFYYLGSLNFLISIPLGFFTLALLLRRIQSSPPQRGQSREARFQDTSWGSAVGLAILAAALFYAHVVSYAAVMLTAFILLMKNALRRRPYIREGCPLLPSVLLAAISFYNERRLAGSESGMSWRPFRDRLFDLLQPFLIYRDDYFHRTVIERLDLPLFAFLALLFLLSLIWAVRPIMPFRESARPATSVGSAQGWWVLGVFLLAALTFPSQIPSASVAHRLSVFVLFASFGIIPAAVCDRRLVKTLFILAALYCFSITAWRAAEFNREMNPFLRAVDRMAPDSRVLPLIQNLHSAHLQTYPFLHILNYYHLAKGGSNPYLLFRNMPQIPVHYRFLDDLPSVGSFDPNLFNWEQYHDRYRYFLAREPSDYVLNQLYAHAQLLFTSKGWYLFQSWQ